MTYENIGCLDVDCMSPEYCLYSKYTFMYCSFVFKVCLLILIDSVTVSHFYNQFLV